MEITTFRISAKNFSGTMKMPKVKELRAKTGLTQTKFGELFHIPLRTIQNWENGTRKPPEWAVYLLEIAVNVYLEKNNKK